ncbi:hypothetical protein SmJEL517_g04003 [Synchytrium microbalum]|uniref:ATP-dependent RNA helicase n=1 Tax=Synchytrium microbalum TaxID=1806994 RepID=A0A507C642_9FUNG|nr:uncharacterized protein SmJEL517_g04003 [Synchytrium microbalum]TPX33013.1 hypothetical protein SmJEL517_g04003 [Synchytrium microbalum]
MDDDLVLNFASVDSEPGRNNVTKSSLLNRLKGSWKARRLRAQKIVHRNYKADHPTAAPATGSEGNGPSSPAATDSDGKIIKRQKTGHDNDTVIPRPSINSRPGKKTVTISSLFTSNPTSNVLFAAQLAASRQEHGVMSTAASFEEIGLDPVLTRNLSTRYSITVPTQIQKIALPALISPTADHESDVIMKAQTGSGKTLAYMLPIIHKLLICEDQGFTPDRTMGLLALILAPTRELAHQIYAVLEKVVSYPASLVPKRRHWMVPGILAGGEKKKSEKARLRKGIHVLVATPGRLLDHLRTTEAFQTSGIRFVVLDEADRLMDLGFEKDLTDIMMILDARMSKASNDTRPSIRGWPRGRQTLLCSATVSEQVDALTKKALKNPIFLDGGRGEGDEVIKKVDLAVESSIKAKSADDADNDDEDDDDEKDETTSAAKKPFVEESLTIPSQLDQTYIIAPAKLRLVTLVAQLKVLAASSKDTFKAIVFMSCKDSVEFHHRILGQPHEVDNNDETSNGGGGRRYGSNSNRDADARGGNGNGRDRQGTDGDQTTDTDPKKNVADRRNVHDDRRIDTTEKKTGTPADLTAIKVTTPEIGIPTAHIPNTLLYKLHGDLPHPARMASFNHFKSQNRAILFCTDVAARGLDLPDISTIIQYDAPFDPKEYVHRVGRTARMGHAGRAVLFLLPSEAEYVNVLTGMGISLRQVVNEDVLKEAFLKPYKKMLKAQYAAADGTRPRIDRSRKLTFEDLTTDLQMDLERLVESDKEVAELAKKAYKSHLRAYATHTSLQKHMFHIKLLHLGHMAKSFGLRDAPADIHMPGSSGSSSAKKKAYSSSLSAAAGKAAGRRIIKKGQKGAIKANFKPIRKDSVYAITKQKQPMSITSEFGDGGSGVLSARRLKR